MKFDFVIGNPPYQDESVGKNSKAPSVYNYFLEEAYKISNIVEMIHPARFLFDAGDTPKNWNKKMLTDSHLKVLYYEPSSSEIFINTNIKGGIAITLHNTFKDYGAIITFAREPIMNNILHKVFSIDFISFSSIVFSPVAYKFTNKMHIENPTLKEKLSKGNEYEVKTNVFETISDVFYDEIPDDNLNYITILGRKNNERVYKYIRQDYITNNTNLYNYKVVVPEANGTGAFGEIISDPNVVDPNVGLTQTFISIGSFNKKSHAEAVLTYIKTKFCRALLGTLKVTQHTSISVWRNVPLQDFTSSSDINWSTSIGDIDKQLYKKYNLSDEEINFIETKVKEME